ncbi:MAG: DNA repair protein RecO [Alphaproteobacteria bacterium]|nr:DNA repair protein RecO [Alphaproteobacteria bacterium]
MIISDEGYIINLRRHGEKSLILTILSKEHGKVVGYVKNCLTPKKLGIYQQGNLVKFEAYARLEENMWSLRIELSRAYAANFLANPRKLATLTSFCVLCCETMPEGQSLEEFYECADNFFKQINEDNWLTYYCHFEFYLLAFLGISLDLEKCSVTGSYDNLRYVSPKTGKAVCAEIGRPYHNRLYAYPRFIIENITHPTTQEIKDLLIMTEFFLHKNFFRTHYLKFPESRANLLHNLDLQEI